MASSRPGSTSICTALGLVIGWLPGLVHGPVAEKWDATAITGKDHA